MTRLLTLFLLLTPTLSCIAQTFEPGSERETLSVIDPTRRVIELIDTGEVGAAWDESSKALKGKTGRLSFISVVNGMRAVAGDIKSRKVKAIGFLQDMPHAPKGRYAAALFDIEFSRARMEEKIVFVKENDQWLLAGYFIGKHLIEN